MAGVTDAGALQNETVELRLKRERADEREALWYERERLRQRAAARRRDGVSQGRLGHGATLNELSRASGSAR
jgi:hypothetical protein